MSYQVRVIVQDAEDLYVVIDQTYQCDESLVGSAIQKAARAAEDTLIRECVGYINRNRDRQEPVDESGYPAWSNLPDRQETGHACAPDEGRSDDPH